PGFSGVALAFNVEEEASVEKVLKAAIAAGGRMIKPAQRAFWGGYSGYFADLDGHLWEVAHNPGFPLDESGQIRLPERYLFESFSHFNLCLYPLFTVRPQTPSRSFQLRSAYPGSALWMLR